MPLQSQLFASGMEKKLGKTLVIIKWNGHSFEQIETDVKNILGIKMDIAVNYVLLHHITHFHHCR